MGLIPPVVPPAGPPPSAVANPPTDEFGTPLESVSEREEIGNAAAQANVGTLAPVAIPDRSIVGITKNVSREQGFHPLAVTYGGPSASGTVNRQTNDVSTMQVNGQVGRSNSGVSVARGTQDKHDAIASASVNVRTDKVGVSATVAPKSNAVQVQTEYGQVAVNTVQGGDTHVNAGNQFAAVDVTVRPDGHVKVKPKSDVGSKVGTEWANAHVMPVVKQYTDSLASGNPLAIGAAVIAGGGVLLASDQMEKPLPVPKVAQTWHCGTATVGTSVNARLGGNQYCPEVTNVQATASIPVMARGSVNVGGGFQAAGTSQYSVGYQTKFGQSETFQVNASANAAPQFRQASASVGVGVSSPEYGANLNLTSKGEVTAGFSMNLDKPAVTWQSVNGPAQRATSADSTLHAPTILPAGAPVNRDTQQVWGAPAPKR